MNWFGYNLASSSPTITFVKLPDLLGTFKLIIVAQNLKLEVPFALLFFLVYAIGSYNINFIGEVYCRNIIFSIKKYA
jgi:hypothetical protein